MYRQIALICLASSLTVGLMLVILFFVMITDNHIIVQYYRYGTIYMFSIALFLNIYNETKNKEL